MSTDVLRRQLSRHLDYVRQLQARNLPPITCAFARLDGDPPGADYGPRYSPRPGVWRGETVMTDAVFHPSNRVSEPYNFSSHTSTTGPCFVRVFYPTPLDGDPLGEWLRQMPFPPGRGPVQRTPTDDALSLAAQVCEALSPVVGVLPPWLAERLGFVRATRAYSWVEALFHLGWHFPDHGIEAERLRVLGATPDAPWDTPCPEIELQLGGVRPSPDAFPGVILSRLGRTSDMLTASANALSLILEALDGIERAARPQPRPEFRELRDAFLRLGEEFARHPRELSAVVLRLADSFRTLPATEWAGIDRGGDGWGLPRVYELSHLDGNRVVCFARGPGLETFHDLANRAGVLLPRWPAEAYPAVLSDVSAFARYCDPERYPWAAEVGDAWNRWMVTDHRGNVERWLGLVFAALMRDRRGHLELVTHPPGITQPTVSPANATLTPRGMNLFLASARAIEQLGLLPRHHPPSSSAETASRVDGPRMSPPGPRSLPPVLRHALALSAAAETLLARFGDEDAGFAEASAEWGAWRGAVAGVGLTEAAALLRGEIDRHPGAPHRTIPDDLEGLWLRVRSWGPGRATTRAEFAGTDHHREWLAVRAGQASLRVRLHHLFAYLGVELPDDTERHEAAAESTDYAALGHPEPPQPVNHAVFDSNEVSVLEVLEKAHPKLLKNVEIEVATSLSKSTVGKVVAGLIDQDLAVRPKGERKGLTITEVGKGLLKQLRNSSADHP